MSGSELIEDLHRKGQERIDRLWNEARRELARFEAEEMEKLSAEEKLYSRKADQAAHAVRQKQRVAAQRQASAIITTAEQDLNKRLLRLAGDILGDLRSGSRTALLCSLRCPNQRACLPPALKRLRTLSLP